MPEIREENEWQLKYLPFVDAVRRFVELVESETELPTPLYLAALNKAILEVASTGFGLRYADTNDDSDFDIDACDPGHDAEVSVRERICRSLAPITAPVKAKNDYEPYDFVMRMLENDIAEGYRDLAHGLRAWDLGHFAARQEAVWDWRFNKGHWHEHLYRALYGLCLFRFNEEDGVDDDFIAREEIWEALVKEGIVRFKE